MATIGSTTEPDSVSASASQQSQGFFSGRMGLKRREAALAYLIILPAMIIIGLFGIFPLLFSIYQSTRAGLNNIVNKTGHFQNDELVFRYAYVDDYKTLNNFVLSVGYVKPFYKPRKKRKYRK